MQELHGLFTKDLLSPTLYRDYSTKAAYKEKLEGFSSAPCFFSPLSAALCKHRLHDEDFLQMIKEHQHQRGIHL